MCSVSLQNMLEIRTEQCGWFSSLALPRQLAADVKAELESPESCSGVAATALPYIGNYRDTHHPLPSSCELKQSCSLGTEG